MTTASTEIAAKIATLPDWRATTLARLRALILDAAPDITEDIKWRKPTNPSGVPCWSSAGKLICTGETYKDKVKPTFAHGASLPEPVKTGPKFCSIKIRQEVREFAGLNAAPSSENSDRGMAAMLRG